MPVESLTSWSQTVHPEGHFQYASCLKARNAMDRLKDRCQRPIRDKCLGPVESSRDPRAIVMSRQNWFPRPVPLNFSTEARQVCAKMAEDIRRRQEIEKRYPGLTMEVVYENIATNPTENIAAMYKFAGINMTEFTTAGLKQITSKSRGISEKWRTQISAERKKLIDDECRELYEITPYDP